MGIGLAMLISAIASTIGTIWSNKKSNDAAKKLAEQSYNKDQEAVSAQNKYNDPAAQMARLKSAGINPAMIYNTGASSAVGNQTQTAKYQAPTQKFDNWLEQADKLPQYLTESQNLKQQSASTQNLESQTKYTDQRTLSEAINAAKLGTEAKRSELQYINELQTSKYHVSKQASEAEAARLRNKNLNNMLNMNNLQVRQLMQNLETGKLKQKTELNTQQLQKADLLFKKYENQLRSKGITSSDNIIIRSAIQNAGDAKDWLSNAWEFLKEGFKPSLTK